MGDNVPQGVYPTEEALRMAQEQGLDLVEVVPNATPPVCRVVDYNKFLYEKKKKDKELKAKAVKSVLKEIRFTPHTSTHDFEFKAKHAENFLKEGARVRAYVQFRGRAIVFKDKGEVLLLKFAKQLEGHAALEQTPKLEGKRMSIILVPAKK